MYIDAYTSRGFSAFQTSAAEIPWLQALSRERDSLEAHDSKFAIKRTTSTLYILFFFSLSLSFLKLVDRSVWWFKIYRFQGFPSFTVKYDVVFPHQYSTMKLAFFFLRCIFMRATYHTQFHKRSQKQSKE